MTVEQQIESLRLWKVGHGPSESIVSRLKLFDVASAFEFAGTMKLTASAGHHTESGNFHSMAGLVKMRPK